MMILDKPLEDFAKYWEHLDSLVKICLLYNALWMTLKGLGASALSALPTTYL